MRARNRWTLLFGSLLTTALVGVVGAQSDLKTRLLALLPDSGQTATEMLWERDPEVSAIELRISQAVQQDPRWFRDYYETHGGEEHVPYHPKFGVTEREYQRVLSSAGVRLVKTSKTMRLTVTRQGNRVTFGGGNGTDILRGLSVDTASGELRIPEGYTAKPHAVSVTVAGNKLDTFGLPSRKGWGWRINPTSGVARTSVWANLTLVQLATGGMLLSYNRVLAVEGKQQREETINLFYEKKF